MSALERLDQQKQPTTNHKYIGVEIECLVRSKHYKKLQDLLIKEGLEFNVTLDADGSVKDDTFIPKFQERRSAWGTYNELLNKDERPEGLEIKILGTEEELPKFVKKTCDILEQVNAYVNDTCGLHVHVDMRRRDVDKVYHNMYRLQDTMLKMVPMYRRVNRFCRPLTKDLMKKIIDYEKDHDDWDNDNDGDDRYFTINRMAYSRHKTIEVRIHEGSLNALEIIRWVGFLIWISDLKKKLKSKSSIEDFRFPQKIKEYVNGRIKKYI